MSDCKVPMPVYSKPEKSSEDIPPIPQDWMAMSIPNSAITIEEYAIAKGFYNLKVSIETSEYPEVLRKFDLSRYGKVDVLVLIKERK